MDEVQEESEARQHHEFVFLLQIMKMIYENRNSSASVGATVPISITHVGKERGDSINIVTVIFKVEQLNSVKAKISQTAHMAKTLNIQALNQKLSVTFSVTQPLFAATRRLIKIFKK